MRAQAQGLSSAANSDGSATRGSVFGRRDDATRASSRNSDGSGAPSRGRLGVLALATALFATLVLAASAFAGKEVVNYFGTASGTGSLGGEFNNPRDIGVNRTGIGAPQGTIYVADDDNNRIQRFDADGDFVSAWGANVLTPAVNEVQTLTVSATAGTYTLTFDGATTGDIAYNATATVVQTALRALPTVSGTNLTVSGTAPYTITFNNSLSATNVAELTADTTLLTGTATPATSTQGSGQYEVCTVAADCRAGVATGGANAADNAKNGSLDNPQSVAVDGDTGNVYVSDRDNRRVNAYDAAGNFIASFGFDTDADAAPLTYEVCAAAARCKFGVAGAGAGQVGTGTTAGTFGIAVSQPDGNAATGTVFLADSGNRRVNTYDLDGANPSSFGTSTEFGTTQPQKIAVDSLGIVYATDSNNDAEVDRYDTENANGGGVGFLAPILATTPARNETQKITFVGFSAGNTFTLTCPNGNPTSNITYATGATGRNNINNALLTNCGAGSFTASGNPPNTTITFQGTFAGTNVPTMICATVTGAGTCSITQEVDGSPVVPHALLEGGSTATAGLAVDPDSDGVGSDEDILYVLRDPSSGNTVVQQFGPANDPGDTAAPTAADDTHGSGAGFGTVNGLGLDDVSGRLLVASSSGVSGVFRHGVYVLDDPLPLPVPLLDPITVKGEETATFSGTVDPRGGIGITCRYHYSTDQTNWTDVNEPDCATLSAGGGAQAISQDVTGLTPNTTYYVRLSVTRLFDPSQTASTPGVRVFSTDSVPPVVTDVGAVQVTDVSARPVGTIDPRNSATGYVFEYGTTPALGSSTEPVDIGGGTTPLTVSQIIEGLSPDTTYYFRLLATNAFGSTPSVQRTFHTRRDPLPPGGGRAFEMVSPPDKNLGSVDKATALLAPKAGVSRDGRTVAFCTSSSFGDPPAQQALYCASYLSRRNPGAGRWDTTSPFPPFCRHDTVSGDVGEQFSFLSPNFDRAVVEQPESAGCAIPPLDPVAPLSPGRTARVLYRQDMTADPFTFDLLGEQTYTAGGGKLKVGHFAAGSDDFSHIVYVSNANQTSPPDSPAPGDFRKIYEWDGGTLRLVSRDTNNDPFTTPSQLAYILIPNGNFIANAQGAVSSDGERIFFQNTASLGPPEGPGGCASSACDLYVREGGAVTFHVSASECTVDCGSDQSGDNFMSATPRGDKALFASCTKLTDSSSPSVSCSAEPGAGLTGSKLYRWDGAQPSGARLIDLTVDNEPADSVQPNVRAPIGASDDGDTVYFAADGQIVSGAPTGPGVKIYRWRWNAGSPSVDYLGAVDGGFGGADGTLWSQSRRRVTPDGEYLLISTRVALDPVVDRDADRDVYRWSAEDGWLCVSCQLPGAPSAGDATSGDSPQPSHVSLFGTAGFFTLLSNEPAIAMSDDGQRIFFDTPDALVPEDVNGSVSCGFLGYPRFIRSCSDVYEWHDGRVSLVSSGVGATPSYMLASTATGRDVFFFTRQRLVGWDVDDGTDIYNARLGGGFPEPPATGAPCEGEACRGAGPAAADLTGAGSAAFVGPGNPRQGAGQACNRFSKQAQRKGAGARKAARKGQVKRARALRKQAKNLQRRAKRCSRRQAS